MQNSIIRYYAKIYDFGFLTLSLDNTNEPLNWLHFFPYWVCTRHDKAKTAPFCLITTFLYLIPSCLEGICACRKINQDWQPGTWRIKMFLCWRQLKERPRWSGGQRCQAAVKALAKKRPNEASGLIYLTCQGQNTPNWGNTLTSPPQADWRFSPLWIPL